MKIPKVVLAFVLFFLGVMAVGFSSLTAKENTFGEPYLGKCDPPVQGPPGPTGPTGPAGPGAHAYAEIYTSIAGASMAVTTIPTAMTTFTNIGIFSGTTPSLAPDQIRIDTTGKYVVTLTICWASASTREWIFDIAVNGIAVSNAEIKRSSNPNSIGSGSVVALMSLTNTDIITVLVNTVTLGVTMNVSIANLSVVQILE